MLRASIEYSGQQANLRGVVDGAKAGDAGIEHGERLTAFAEAVVKGSPAELETARDALRDAAGSAALVDAAAVAGNFERMVRIADGTGIPLDGVVSTLTDDIREDLRLDDYQSRRMLDRGSLVNLFAPVARGLARGVLRSMGWGARRR